ncbi:MAG: hypothetical protein WAJ88_17880 [Pseudolabrys sp.]
MSRFILSAIGLGIALAAAPAPTVAQKQSCDAYCAAKVCATLIAKTIA